jgi:quinoprotein glucose dehydrogenase
LRAEALELIKDYRWGPLFTPPSEEVTVHLPGLLGGNNWAGGVWHPGTGMLYVRSRTMPSLAILNRIDDEASHTRYSADSRIRLSGPRGLPLFKPPYGRVTAIDMGTGETLPAPQGAYKTRCPPP